MNGQGFKTGSNKGSYLDPEWFQTHIHSHADHIFFLNQVVFFFHSTVRSLVQIGAETTG